MTGSNLAALKQMHDFLLSVFLGIVEGLTEFLPVSSTAHLRIVEALFHLDLQDSFWKMYTVVIQLGAILALAGLFLESDPAISFRPFRAANAGDRTVADSSADPDDDRICRDGGAGVSLDKIRSARTWKILRHGVGAAPRAAWSCGWWMRFARSRGSSIWKR